MSDANAASMQVDSADELGLYRSLSTLSVISLVMGLLSFLAFAPTNIFIWVFPPAALVTGLIALRQITAAPEAWTGGRFAKTGIVLAVLCTIGAVGEKKYNSARIARSGKAVADRFLNKLKQGDIEAAFWLTFHRDQRQQVMNNTIAELPSGVMERYGSFRTEVEPHVAALAGSEVSIEFERVERTGSEGEAEYAALIYRIHAPQGDSRVLIVAFCTLTPTENEPSWMIRQQKFDYTPGEFGRPVASGHGHSH